MALIRRERTCARAFEDEVSGLLESGVSRDRLHEIGFEYKLMLDLLDKKINKKEFFERFEQKNWQYAKRQLTWLKRDKSIKWFKREAVKEITSKINDWLAH